MVITGGLLAVDLFLLSVIWPQAATTIAIDQLRPDDVAASTLRMAEASKNGASLVIYGLVLFTAIALFAKDLHRMVSREKEEKKKR